MGVRRITHDDLHRNLRHVARMPSDELDRVMQRCFRQQRDLAAATMHSATFGLDPEQFHVIMVVVLTVWTTFQEASAEVLAAIEQRMISQRMDENLEAFEHFDKAGKDPAAFEALMEVPRKGRPQREVVDFALGCVKASQRFDHQARATQRILIWVKGIVEAFCYTYPEPGWVDTRAAASTPGGATHTHE